MRVEAMPDPQKTSMQVSKTSAGYVVRMTGRGTMLESPALAEFAAGCLAHSSDSLVVDLSECEYLDSTLLGCLVTLHRRFGNAEPPRFEIAAAADVSERLLGPTRLVRFFNIIEEAPASLDTSIPLECSMPERNELGTHIMRCHKELADLGGPESDAFARIAERLSRELGES